MSEWKQSTNNAYLKEERMTMMIRAPPPWYRDVIKKERDINDGERAFKISEKIHSRKLKKFILKKKFIIFWITQNKHVELCIKINILRDLNYFIFIEKATVVSICWQILLSYAHVFFMKRQLALKACLLLVWCIQFLK